MDIVRTKIGRALFDDYEHRGLRVFRDLSGRISYLGLVAFSITGRRLSREDESILDDIAVCSFVSEPRVWPIKLARLVSSMGRTVPGYVAGTVVLDGTFLGGGMVSDVARFLLEFEDLQGDDVEAFLAARRPLPGFGVPARPKDERLVALRSALSRYGRTERRHWKCAERLAEVVRRTNGLEANIALGFAASLLDLGFHGDEISALVILFLQPAALANAVEGAEQRAAVLRSLPPEAVRYEGPPPRVSPRAAAHRGPIGSPIK